MILYAQKGNLVSRIEESQINELLNQGYDIIDEKGSVLHKAVPTDPVLLKRAYVDNMRQIEELKKEIEALKAAQKKSVAKAETAKATKAEATKAEAPKEEAKTVEKPKKSGRKTTEK